MNLKTLRKSRWVKATLYTGGLTLIFQLVSPGISYALTGGPQQPEFQGFTQVDTGNLVDPFTGDFKYQIPLMTIPGPNGGYPLNLTYAAGPSLEEEASWVGLGWSLNVGAVNRQMRGVPDDFLGDRITKVNYTKPNITIGFGIGIIFTLQEIYGADLGTTLSLGINSQFYSNNYTGFGYRHSISPSFGLSAADNESSGGFSSGLSLNFDSNEGADVQPTFGLKARHGHNSVGMDFGFGYSGRQGFQGMYMSSSYTKHSERSASLVQARKLKEKTSSRGSNFSFAVASGVPRTSVPLSGTSFAFSIKPDMGIVDNQFKIPITFQGRFSMQRLEPGGETSYQSGVGLHYAGETPVDGNFLMDYNIEKDAPINIKIPNLPIPVSTHDIYSVQAAQLGLSFRNYRNDMGIFYEPAVLSKTVGAEIGIEAGAGSGFKVGATPRVSFAMSYSGPWKGNASEVLGKYKFRGTPDHALLTNGDNVRQNSFSYLKVSGEPTADIAGSGFRMSHAGGAPGPTKFPIHTTDASNPDFSSDELGDDYENSDLFSNVQQFTTGITPQLGTQALGTNLNDQRHRKNTLIEYRTQQEVEDNGDGILKGHYVAASCITPETETPMFDVDQPYTFPTTKKHHIAEYSVLEPGGMRYTFGLPAYNKKQLDVTFAINVDEQSDASNTNKLIKYVTGGVGADRVRNFQGRDQFYSMTEMPEYTHSHLLTLIASPDYVDVTDDGPTEDDYGYYTKFNYYRAHGNYKWRTPYEKDSANHHKGFYSSALDNKGSYVYGEKEVWYVHSIETKTHVAVFVLEDRKDAHGVLDKDGGINTGQKLKCLKEIRLYAKKQIVNGVLPEKPIKTVVFDYTYELCKNIPNTTNTGTNPNEPKNLKGKLTLKSVHFLYNGNKRGELNPYRFEYDINPDYDQMQSDRWGNYRSDAGTMMGNNEENPYVNQDESDAAKALRNENAGAWSVTRITTPSNAVIEIDYEQDDYAFVQDKLATQMFQIIGTGNLSGTEVKLLECDYVDNTLGLNGDAQVPISDNYRRIYFRPEIDQARFDAMSHNQRNSYVKSHIAALTDGWLYFKTWQRLQRPKNRTYWAEDYVTGYARVVNPLTAGSDYGYITESGKHIPYLCVETAGNNVIKNPLQLAGLQYLRYSRGDLNMPQNLNNNVGEGAITLITSGLTMILQLVELISGYYSYAKLNNYCKFIGSEKASFVRLTTPDGRKYGGGHRVKSIKVHDGWNEASLSQEEYVYKQDYFYTDAQGRSSGVAAYEPALGNDENALKYPYYYSPDNKYNNDPAFLTEAPFNESYYPAPVVGYARVVVRSDINYNDQEILNQNEPLVKASGDAVRVHEFYTAKDYPVITENTKADNVKNIIPIPIPLIGGIQISNYGYSQGYMIELNDMHGKPKAEHTYAASAWDYANNRLRNDAAFVSSVTYKYNTLGGYSPNKVNRINSVLQVMDGEGQTRFAVVGESADVFSNLREDSGFSISAGAQINGGIDVLPYMGFVSAMPGIEYSENTARTSVTNKVVYKTGMLTETVERMEGAVKTTANLLFDAENGQPLLTAVTTDYDDHHNSLIDAPIYTYTMPAHWYYEGMRAAYRNYRTRINFSGIASNGQGVYDMSHANSYLHPGDVIEYYDTGNTFVARAWVDQVGDDSFRLIDDGGAPYATTLNGHIVVVRSGHRNLQNQTAGTIVSLYEWGLENLGIFKLYNSMVYGHESFMSIPVNVAEFEPEDFESINLLDPCTELLEYTWTESPYITSDESGNVDFISLGTIQQVHDDDEEGMVTCNMGFWIEDVGEGMIPASEFAFNRIRLYSTGNGEGHAIFHFGDGHAIKVKIKLMDPDCLFAECMDNILDAKAVEYQHTWNYPGDFPVPSLAQNLWLTTESGVWRVLRTNTYFVERKQGGTTTDFKSYIGRDGTYDRFIPFNFLDGNQNNQQMDDGWRWAAEVPPTGYGRGGYELENRNALGIYSSELFGFRQSSVIAVAANARYHEIGFESFERPGQTGSYSGPLDYIDFLAEGESNHIIFDSEQHPNGFSEFGNFTVSSEKSHTGLLSLKLGTGPIPFGVLPIKTKVIDPITGFDPNYDGIQLVPGKRYLMSYWFHDGNNGGTHHCVSGAVTNGLQVALGQTVLEESIDGWRKTTLEFTAPNTAAVPFQIILFMVGNPTYIDDIRIHPTDASFKSYVYDPLKFMLKAELDDNNYATLYNYNVEGNLVQVKKETRDGLRTIRTTRKHAKPVPEPN